MKNGEKPAFPNEDALKGGDSAATGLTKREYFAAMAMQGLMAVSDKGVHEEEVFKVAAEYAIKMADELLKQLGQ